MQGTYQKHMLSALGAPQRQVPAVRAVHAVGTLRSDDKTKSTLIFVNILKVLT